MWFRGPLLIYIHIIISRVQDRLESSEHPRESLSAADVRSRPSLKVLSQENAISFHLRYLQIMTFATRQEMPLPELP